MRKQWAWAWRGTSFLLASSPRLHSIEFGGTGGHWLDLIEDFFSLILSEETLIWVVRSCSFQVDGWPTMGPESDA